MSDSEDLSIYQARRNGENSGGGGGGKGRRGAGSFLKNVGHVGLKRSFNWNCLKCLEILNRIELSNVNFQYK